MEVDTDSSLKVVIIVVVVVVPAPAPLLIPLNLIVFPIVCPPVILTVNCAAKFTIITKYCCTVQYPALQNDEICPSQHTDIFASYRSELSG